jgi:enoyl-[acyl-carrier protein] reductase II
VDQLRELLGKGRAKKGMFEGALDEGELEIGQISGMTREVKPAAEIVREILEDFARAQKNICKVNLLEATKSPK